MSPKEKHELVAEDELYELFAPHRPQPEQFRAGVDESVAEREADGGALDSPALSGLWRRVAAYLPLDPLTGGLAGSAIGKAAAPKLLPAALALPALILAGALGGFLASARSLKHASQNSPPARLGTPRARQSSTRLSSSWSSLLNFATLVSLAVTTWLGGGLAIDFLCLVLVISMGALVLTVRQLSRAALLSRETVARVAVGLLSSIFVGCFLWFPTLRLADDVTYFGMGACSAMILLGCVLCLLASRQNGKAAAGFAILLALVGGLNILGVTQSTTRSMQAQYSAYDLDPLDLHAWDAAWAVSSSLRAVGAQIPERPQLAQELSAAIQAGDDVHPTVYSAAHSMGLLEPEDWERLAQKRYVANQLEGLASERPNLSQTRYYEYLLHLFLATHAPDAEQVERLAGMALGFWPETGEHGALHTALLSVRIWLALDRADFVEAQRAEALALLSAHWISGQAVGTFAKVGGFTPNPEKFRTSFDDETLAALELMGHYGTPADIDLDLVHSFLRRESVAFPLFEEWHPYLRGESRAGLLRLRMQIGLPERGLLELLLKERLLIASILIVLLCLLAIRMASPSPLESGEGAKP